MFNNWLEAPCKAVQVMICNWTAFLLFLSHCIQSHESLLLLSINACRRRENNPWRQYQQSASFQSCHVFSSIQSKKDIVCLSLARSSSSFVWRATSWGNPNWIVQSKTRIWLNPNRSSEWKIVHYCRVKKPNIVYDRRKNLFFFCLQCS